MRWPKINISEYCFKSEIKSLFNHVILFTFVCLSSLKTEKMSPTKRSSIIWYAACVRKSVTRIIILYQHKIFVNWRILNIKSISVLTLVMSFTRHRANCTVGFKNASSWCWHWALLVTVLIPFELADMNFLECIQQKDRHEMNLLYQRYFVKKLR